MTPHEVVEQQAFIVDGRLAERFLQACRKRGLSAPIVIEHMIQHRLWDWSYEVASAQQTWGLKRDSYRQEKDRSTVTDETPWIRWACDHCGNSITSRQKIGRVIRNEPCGCQRRGTLYNAEGVEVERLEREG